MFTFALQPVMGRWAVLMALPSLKAASDSAIQVKLKHLVSWDLICARKFSHTVATSMFL